MIALYIRMKPYFLIVVLYLFDIYFVMMNKNLCFDEILIVSIQNYEILIVIINSRELINC